MDDNVSKIQEPTPTAIPQPQLETLTSREDEITMPKENIILKIFRYILVAFSFLSAISVIFDFGLLQLIGSLFYLITAIFLIKRPKVGYILFAVATILFFSALILYRLTANY